MLSSFLITDYHSRLILFLGIPQFFLSTKLIEGADLGTLLGGVWGGGLVVGWVVGGWTGQKQAPPPLLKILDVGFLVGVVPLEALLSKFHEALATAHTFAR